MPHINIFASKAIDAQTKNKLQLEIANSMEIIPGKTPSNTLICISDNFTMYRDTQAIEAVFLEIRLYKNSPEESKKKFAEHIFNIMDTVLKVPASNVQINFIELPEWAAGGNYF